MTVNQTASRNKNAIENNTPGGPATQTLNTVTNLRASSDVKRSKAKKHSKNKTNTNGSNKDASSVGSSVLQGLITSKQVVLVSNNASSPPRHDNSATITNN